MTGRREHNKRQTRRSLQDAARRLFSERGFDQVCVEDIATEVLVSRRTFFNYFDSKEAALVDPDPSRLDTLAALLAARPADEPLLNSLCAVHIQFLMADPADFASRMRLVRANPALRQRWVTAIEIFDAEVVRWACTCTGLPPEAVYPQLLAALVGTVSRLAMEHWDPDTPPEQLAEVISCIYRLLAVLGNDADLPPADPGCEH
ncbi:transcriptional regulator [Actinoplanes sp. SE50]|uniref:TetR family transcriptional regulator n=1 Tax=unclassified Actinoplanes TaxID=2626549 RepID=UPI00023ED443|nr:MULTISPECIES: TetR family transcriptional regulator [unclassified Actinoplanes]AEV84454.1 HTH-type transcriptional regulator tcmR [Actinoplanes sp. SE50/110]ATO82846.1 transcriptional regulator [Actinoplanes sp. SE50]SLM00254.1 TetR family transcriptional regulator [Actinoplanes sp. SE50/110]